MAQSRHLVPGGREHLRLFKSESRTRSHRTQGSNLEPPFSRRRISDSAQAHRRAPLDSRAAPIHTREPPDLPRSTATSTGLERNQVHNLLLCSASIRGEVEPRLRCFRGRELPSAGELGQELESLFGIADRETHAVIPEKNINFVC